MCVAWQPYKASFTLQSYFFFRAPTPPGGTKKIFWDSQETLFYSVTVLQLTYSCGLGWYWLDRVVTPLQNFTLLLYFHKNRKHCRAHGATFTKRTRIVARSEASGSDVANPRKYEFAKIRRKRILLDNSKKFPNTRHNVCISSKHCPVMMSAHSIGQEHCYCRRFSDIGDRHLRLH